MHLNLKNYKIVDKLAENAATILYRAQRIRDNLSVILKVLKPELANQDTLTRFRNEYDIISKLGHAGIIKSVALEEYDNSLIIILKDFAADSLDTIIKKFRLSLIDSINLMINLTEIVGFIHKEHIIHKGINPSSVFYNPDTKEIKIIDFSQAVEAPGFNPTAETHIIYDRKLDYYSPEQTGRMNRKVDYRTDFYSLGIIFYQLLTGKLPFKADDAIGIVHSHMAKIPDAPCTLDASIPEMVSGIVMKLMAKMADSRYQSTWGLKTDLEMCINDLNEIGSIREFELGLEDYSDHLRFPDKLYGRDKDLKQLLNAFGRASKGECEFLLVSGHAGIGKTTFVREIHKTVLEKQGFFIEGKFEQWQSNIPYYAWTQAFEDLVNYLLMGSESDLSQWKKTILKAVGNVGKILTDVIPNLAMVIGKQPDIQVLDSFEAQNRFNYVFLEFINAIATAEHPIAIFLDDLQWIDKASLSLMQTFVSSKVVSNILIIGSYREDEIDDSLKNIIEKINIDKSPINLIKLEELTEKTVNELIADTLHQPISNIRKLTRVLYTKTGGNPLFLLQMLEALVEKQGIKFSLRNRSWMWDLDKIKSMEITNNVLTLLLRKIEKLPVKTRNLLSLAACLGYRFEILKLGIIAKQTRDYVVNNLRTAIKEGLILPQSKGYQFVHDRIQQAAYSFIQNADIKKVHLQIGKLLLKENPEPKEDEQLFTIVDHLNIGYELIKSQKDNLELVRLNLQAGLRAKVSAAFSVAEIYLRCARNLLKPSNWKSEYDLTLTIFKESAECEYLGGNYVVADELIKEAVLNTRNVIDQSSVLSIQVTMYNTLGRFIDSIMVGISGLSLLGIKLPDIDENEVLRDSAEQEMANCYKRLTSMDLFSIIDVHEMSDPVAKACGDVISKMLLAAYFHNRDLYKLLIARLVRLLFENGNSNISALGYVLMAGICIKDFNDYKTANILGQISQKLLQRYKSSVIESKTLQFYYNTVAIWFLPLVEVVDLQRQAFVTSLESGVFDDAQNNLWGIFRSLLVSTSVPIDNVLEECENIISFSNKIKSETFSEAVTFLRKAVSSLQSGIDIEKDDISILKQYEQAGIMTIPAHYNIFMSWALFMMGRFDEALNRIKENQEFIEFVADQPNSIYHYFHYSLLLLRHSELTEEQNSIISKNQEILNKLAINCPDNYRHAYLLVEAECKRFEGNIPDAINLYDEAIDAAAQNNSNYIEGIACELTAKFWQNQGKEHFAALYIKRSHKAYSHWHAWAKVKALESSYPHWLQSRIDEQQELESKSLDLNSLVKTTRTISSKIEMNTLLSELMNIIIENAGAQNGALFLEKEGIWQLVAQRDTGTTKFEVIQPVNLDTCKNIAQSVVNFVINTKENVVLDDASGFGDFISDPYIKKEKIKSLMCIPLLNQQKLISVIYLENNLTTHTFTVERVQLLEILLSQAVISLENAGIYENLRESERKYRTLFETMVQGVVYQNASGKIIAANPAAENILGLTVDQMSGKKSTDPNWQAIHEDGSEFQGKTHPAMVAMKTGKEVRNVIMGVFHPGKEDYVWININAMPQFKPGEKKPFQVYTTFEDITKRKRAEEKIKNLAEDEKKKRNELIEKNIELKKARMATLNIIEDLSREVEERKRAQLKITQLAAIVEFSNDAIIGKTLTGIITSWNKGAEKIYGYNETEMIGHPFSKLTPSESRADLDQVFEKIINKEHVEHFETVGLRKDGQLINLSLTISPVPDSEGKIISTSIIGRDITAQKQIEEELQEKHKLLLEAQKIAHIGNWWHDLVTGEIFWSDEFFRMIGREPREPNVEMAAEVIHPDDIHIILDAMEESAAGKPEHEHDFRIIRPNGDIRWLHNHWISIYDENGKELKRVGTHQDITERKRTEEKILRSEQRLRLHHEQSPLGFLEWDENFCAAEWNAACEKIFGYSREEAIGRHAKELILPAEVHDLLDGIYNSLMTRRGGQHSVNANITKEGRIITCEWYNTTLTDNEGKSIGVASVCMDITERIQAEEALRKSENLLSKIAENFPNSYISIVEKDLTIGFTSGQEFKKQDLDPKTFIGLTLKEIFEDQSEIVKKHYLETFSGKETSFELCINNQYQHYKTVPLPDESGEINRILVVVENITDRKQIENVLTFVAQQGWSASGEEFFNAIVRYIGSIFNLDYVIIDKLVDNDKFAETAGFYAHGEIIPPVRYELLNTPCDNVAGKKLCYYPNDVQKMFPHDSLLAEMKVESYIGIPLWDSIGKPIGLIAILHSKPMQNPEGIKAVLQITATRVAAELERIKADNILRESEERYRMVFENSPVSIWEEDFSEVKVFLDDLKNQGIKDIEVYFDQHPEVIRRCAEMTKIIDVNQAALTLHEAQRKEELLEDILKTFTSESFDTFRQELVCLWNGETEMIGDAVVQTLQGALRQVTISFAVCPGYEETLSKVIVSLIDITDRKRIEEALSASEAELRTLVNAMTDVILVINSEGRYLKIPETNPSLLYKPPQELLGKTLHEIFPKEQADFFLKQVKQAQKTKNSFNFEYSLMIEDNEIWFNATISPLSDDIFLLVARDITERKQMAESLATREREFRTLAENSPDNIIRYDEDCRTVYANPSLEKTLKIPVSEIIGKKPTEIAPIDELIKYEQNISAVFKTGKSIEMDMVMPDVGEGVRFHNIQFVVEKGQDGKIKGVLAIGRDVTDRRKAEQEIQKLNMELEQRVIDRTAQLELANKELESFAYSVSHDLRAPLRSIDGFSMILIDDFEDKLDAKGKDYLNRVRMAAQRMGYLIDDMLSLSRVTRYEMKKQMVNLSDLAHEIADELESSNHERHVDFVIEDDITVEGDGRLLRIALDNLIGNSWKFTSTKPSAKIKFGTQIQNNSLVFYVKDNGVGFNTRYANKLFTAFQRLHSSSEFPGIGIGLAIVQRVIHRHGGEVWANSKVNKGATFYFSLPKRVNQDKRNPKEES